MTFKFSPEGRVKIIMCTVGGKAYLEDETACGKRQGKEFDTCRNIQILVWSEHCKGES